jgi:hypothetical protein
MRTRIALVAIIPIASIIVTVAALLAASSSARAASPASTTPATPAPSDTTTSLSPTTTAPPSTPVTATTPGPAPSSTVPPFPGLRPISPVLTETTLLVNLNTALRNEADFHQALINETQFLEAMDNEAQFHQAISNEVRFYETLLSESSASGPSSAGTAVAAMGLPYTTTALSGSGDTVTPSERAAWERVAVCEEGGNWNADNGGFSGGLGITRTNWIAYGGGAFAPEGAMATEDEQIMVAERIQADAPDQGGCHGW